MSLLSSRVTILILLGAFGLTGCSRPALSSKKNGDKGNVRIAEANPFRSMLEAIRYPENPRASDDWTRFRDAFPQMNSHFSSPEVVARMRLSAADRKFLETEAHLTEAELAEVESTSFRPADAHYLDECFLLRSAARSLEIAGQEPFEQAHHLFRWVMRNVLYHEQGDSWIPPAFTLKLGYGGPVDRACVFLALLRQAQIEGCLIAVPDSDPLQFLVAVVDAKSSRLRLFDPRLGLAVMTRDGKSIASLQEALGDPALLQPSQMEKAKTLEVWLACPLYALAPRLLELQKGLSQHDPAYLYLDAPELHREVSKLTKLPVKVWNPPAEGKKLANSPTRSLRLFLPRSEGGIDESRRSDQYTRMRIPFQKVLLNYTSLNLQLAPKPVFDKCIADSVDFFQKYDLQMRKLYLRGQHEAMIRRQERLKAFTEDYGLVGLLDNPAFRKEVAKWQNQLIDAFADLDNPRFRDEAQQTVHNLWGKDLFLEWLLDLEAEKKLDNDPLSGKLSREYKQTMQTRILAAGLRDYFALELIRTQASTSQEKAERLEAGVRASAKPTRSAKEKASQAWVVANGSWSDYVAGIPLEQMITRRLEQLRLRVHPDDLEKRFSIVENLHFDVQKYFHGKLRVAACQEHRNGAKAAAGEFEALKRQIEEYEKKGLLKTEVNSLGKSLERFPGYQKRFERLAHNWSERGSYYWLKQHVERRLALLR